MSEFVVEMKNIVKSFGEVHAVKDGQFNLIKGEIHSLIGEKDVYKRQGVLEGYRINAKGRRNFTT